MHTLDLGQGCVDEVLVTEARIYRHDEHQIQVWKNFLEDRGGRGGVDGHADFFAQALHALDGAM